MAIRRTRAVLLAAAIFGMSGQAQVPAHQRLTLNGDGALRDQQIHWPKEFEPEQADLFAHNEIHIQAGCAVVFSNLVGAEAWPSWYSSSKNVKVLNTPDHRLRKNTRIYWEPSDSTSKAACESSNQIAASDGSEMARTSMPITLSFLPGPLRGATSSQKRLRRVLPPFSTVSRNRMECTRRISFG
jgi:hypothetical protein